MMKLVTATVTQRKRTLPRTDSAEFGRQICDVLGDEMHDLAFTLHHAFDRDHSGAKDDAPIRVEDFWPNYNVRDAGLVFHRDEHCAFRRSWPLTNQNQILTTQDEIDIWLTGDWKIAQVLQRPLSDAKLILVE